MQKITASSGYYSLAPKRALGSDRIEALLRRSAARSILCGHPCMRQGCRRSVPGRNLGTSCRHRHRCFGNLPRVSRELLDSTHSQPTLPREIDRTRGPLRQAPNSTSARRRRSRHGPANRRPDVVVWPRRAGARDGDCRSCPQRRIDQSKKDRGDPRADVAKAVIERVGLSHVSRQGCRPQGSLQITGTLLVSMLRSRTSPAIQSRIDGCARKWRYPPAVEKPA